MFKTLNRNDRTSTRITYTSGTSYAPGMSIDGYISPEDKEKLYKLWKSEWKKPLEYRGSVYVITCEHIIETGYDAIKKVYGKRFADRVFPVAEINAVLI